MPSVKDTLQLDDATIKNLPLPANGRDWYRDADPKTRGLMLSVASTGTRTWRYEGEYRPEPGRRLAISQHLGQWPTVTPSRARKAVLSILGKREDKKVAPGKLQAGNFEAALNSYIDDLERRAKAKGKPARWAKQLRWQAKAYLIPRWGTRTLLWLLDHKNEIKQWHEELSDSGRKVLANKLARTMRAVYRDAARTNRALPRDEHPAEGINWNDELPQGHPESKAKGSMPYSAFPDWRKKLDEIESPTRRAFHAINLLTGCRPGELARLKIDDVDFEKHRFIVRATKNGDDHIVHTTPEIENWLRLAIENAPKVRPNTLFVFPSVRGGHMVRIDGDGLSHTGMSLRGTYTTIAFALGAPDIAVDFLTGHKPGSVTRRYAGRRVLDNDDPILPETQQKISDRIVELWAKGK